MSTPSKLNNDNVDNDGEHTTESSSRHDKHPIHPIVNKKSKDIQKDKGKKPKAPKTPGVQTNMQHVRRTGAMSVTGQLYETKLLTLILLRFLNNHTAEFYLGANISGAGALDDLCFKYKPANSEKHITVFLQAKHKVNPDKGKITMTDVQSYGGDFSVEKHFESYLMIRQRFTPKSSDIIFKGAYHDSQCYFVVYTPLKHDIQCRRPLELNDTNNNVKDLIQTNCFGEIFQHELSNVGFLSKNLVHKRVEQLGKVFSEYIINGNQSNNEIDKLIKMYHVVLAQNVVEVGNDGPEGACRTCYKFRSEFFDNNENLVSIFRESLYNHAVHNKSYHINDKQEKILLRKVIDDPSAENLATIMGNIVTYDEKTNLLVKIDNENEKSDKDIIDIQFITQKRFVPLIIRSAVNIKGRDLLERLQFELPIWFGNKDLTLKKSDAKKIENRLCFLKTSFVKLFGRAVYSNNLNFVTVDERMVGPDQLIARGVVEHGGGLGSALGNLLVLDVHTGALKFNTSEPLPDFAGILWNKLKDDYDESLLKTYRFRFLIDGFPKAIFEDCLSEKYLVKEFVDQYWLCSGQAKEDAVELEAKKEVIKYIKAQTGNKAVFRAKSDAIFLMLHDKMQKWWMLPVAADYLTADTTYLQTAMSQVVDNPLLSVLNFICLNKLRAVGIEFDEEAVKLLGIDDASCSLKLIVSDLITHTAIKLMQHYKNSQTCTFIDFNYLVSLDFCDLKDLVDEMKNSILNKLIISCTITDENENICETLVQFMENVPIKRTTIISSYQLAMELKQVLTCYYDEVNDHNNGLNYLCSESQQKILNECKVLYQGEEVILKSIIGDNSLHLIESHIIQKLVKKEVIKIGNPISTSDYERIERLYIPRRLIRDQMSSEINSTVKYTVTTLKDLEEQIIVITAPIGMGKSTLLTHLSLETKKKYPTLWIARINLMDHSKQFLKWQQKKTGIDKIVTLSFLCKVVVIHSPDNELDSELYDIMVTGLLEKELFIHLCNEGQVIFVFDGFDEICPLYEKEVIQLMKATAAIADPRADTMKKPKLWIASRSYNNVKHVLEREFGMSFRLSELAFIDQSLYMEKFWSENLKLDKLDPNQLINVNSFMEYMKTNKDKLVLVTSNTLRETYLIAMRYCQSKVRNSSMPEIQFITDSWIVDPYLDIDVIDDEDVFSSPLLANMAAEYFEYKIKGFLPIDDRIWELDYNTTSFYKMACEIYLSKIRFINKNNFDVSKVDNKQIYQWVQTECTDRHRKLAYYSLCKDNDNQFMDPDEMNRVMGMIEEIKNASEKAGVTDCVLDGVPCFVNSVLAAHFAADYVGEALKRAYTSHQEGRLEKILKFLTKEHFFCRRKHGNKNVDFWTSLSVKFSADNSLRFILYSAVTRDIINRTTDKDSPNHEQCGGLRMTYKFKRLPNLL